MIHQNTSIIITVMENRSETAGHRSIVFERPINFEYESGDWIDIKFGETDLRGGITYSLSSSPTDDVLMITFKDGLSEIKSALAAAQLGDKLRIIQYGNDYKFSLNPLRASTLIAGGVGVTPFRSMIREMEATKSKNNVHLLYLNRSDNYLFKPELDKAAATLSGLKLTYIVTKEMNKKARDKALWAAIAVPGQSFYIAGPEAMVETTEHLLLDFGVALSDIKIDSFSGY